jgi:hypothetical protein
MGNHYVKGSAQSNVRNLPLGGFCAGSGRLNSLVHYPSANMRRQPQIRQQAASRIRPCHTHPIKIKTYKILILREFSHCKIIKRYILRYSAI